MAADCSCLLGSLWSSLSRCIRPCTEDGGTVSLEIATLTHQMPDSSPSCEIAAISPSGKSELSCPESRGATKERTPRNAIPLRSH